MSDFQQRYDAATARFTDAMKLAAKWRQYMGAAYSTRIRQAIKDAKQAIFEMETILEEENNK